MAWSAIPDTDIDENSALKTNDVLRKLRDNPEAIHAGTAPTLVDLTSATNAGQPYGLFRPDGLGGVVISPMESSDMYVLDESNPAWRIPDGARQIIVEVWGAGGGNGSDGGKGFNERAGFAGAYALKLLDVDWAGGFTTLAVIIGEGGSVGGFGGSSSVVYKSNVIACEGGPCFVSGGANAAAASGGDINMGGGYGRAVRGGDVDPDTGNGVCGGAGAAANDAGQYFGGNGRVIVRVIG